MSSAWANVQMNRVLIAPNEHLRFRSRIVHLFQATYQFFVFDFVLIEEVMAVLINRNANVLALCLRLA